MFIAMSSQSVRHALQVGPNSKDSIVLHRKSRAFRFAAHTTATGMHRSLVETPAIAEVQICYLLRAKHYRARIRALGLGKQLQAVRQLPLVSR
jgi:hypothetical protein